MDNNGGMRKLRKVQYAFYEDKLAKPHPVIRIAGKYLERFGFRIGDTVEVEIADGRIMVQKLSEPDGNYTTAKGNPRESSSEKR
ncbi:MAG TPA: SymE family type I addiction module toxin [Candidatus Acidoferrales bacterium]|nr:SymE family type I addiction module toxin [Candidatus Acidoferrales bacterium]